MTTTEQRERHLRTLEGVTVENLMHRGIVHCPPETPLKIVARMMAANKIHSVVVFGDPGNYNDEHAWRIVSDVDLVGLALSDLTSLTAADAATGEILTVVPGDPMTHAARVMADNRTSHLVVVDEESAQPVGILSSLDIASALAHSAASVSRAALSPERTAPSM